MVYGTSRLFCMFAKKNKDPLTVTLKKSLKRPTKTVPHELPPLPSPRDLLKLYRIQAQRHLSQNFLLDKRLNNKIVTRTGKMDDCYVCEVGPGPGNITRHILQNGAKKVTVIEKDYRFLPSLEQLSDACKGRMEIIVGDIMDLSLQEMFPKELAMDWTTPSPPFYIIGNLPFSVSTPLIIRWLRYCSTHSGPFTYGRTQLTLTFQKEVGDRMIAKPASDCRCRLSLMCQYLCHVEKLFDIPGRAFFPKPEVDVSVMKFTPRIKPYIEQPFSLVEKVARTLFHTRRKECSRTIRLLFPLTRPEFVEEVFKRTHINPRKTVTHLNMDEFKALCDVYSDLCSENKDLIDFDFRAPKKLRHLLYGHKEQYTNLDPEIEDSEIDLEDKNDDLEENY